MPIPGTLIGVSGIVLGVNAGDGTVTVIKPPTSWDVVRFGELWRYRELLYFFTWRDLKVRYKQTILGSLWAVLQPVLTMVVFTVFFGGTANIDTGGVPYPLFSLAGLVPWTLFSFGLQQASLSLVSNTALLTKVYFPRMILPIAAVLVGIVDFVLSLLVLLGMIIAYGQPITWRLLAVIPCAVLAGATSVAVGTLLSAIAVRYRDVKFTIPFLAQIWLFVTPIIYPLSSVAPGWKRTLLSINPMTGVVTLFRWATVDGPAPAASVWISVLVTAGLLGIGARYFARTEQMFADVA